MLAEVEAQVPSVASRTSGVECGRNEAKAKPKSIGKRRGKERYSFEVARVLSSTSQSALLLWDIMEQVSGGLHQPFPAGCQPGGETYVYIPCTVLVGTEHLNSVGSTVGRAA